MPTRALARVLSLALLLVGSMVVSPLAEAADPAPYRVADGLDGSLYAGGGVTLGDKVFWAVAPTTTQPGLHGIWTSDGTGPGTRKLVDLDYAGPPQRFGDGFVFIGDDGAHGSELWYSDGTAAGTSMVADLDEDTGTSSGTSLIAVVDGAVFLSADDGTHGAELYRWTGSGVPQLLDLNTTLKEAPFDDRAGQWRSQWTDSWPSPLGTVGDVFYFSADDTHRAATEESGSWYVNTTGTGRELWRVGPSGAPTRVRDITPGTNLRGDPNSTDFDRSETAVLDGSLYFLVTALGKPELWRTDGTSPGTVRVSDALPVYWDEGNGHWNFHPAVAGDKLFYAAWTEASSYDGIWATTGSGSGSRVSPAGDAGAPVALGDKVVFSLDRPGSGREPWVSDGVASTMLADIVPTAAGSVPFPFTTWRGHTYFGARSSTGRDLWRTDGTPSGTRKLHDLPNAPNAFADGPIVFTPASTVLYFWNSPDDTRHAGNELWAFDPERQPAGAVSLAGPDVVAYGTTPAVSVTVTGIGTPAGSVTLRDGATVLGTVSLAGGKAVFTLPPDLALGLHTLTASYAGDGTNPPSSSAPFTIRVKAASSLAGRISGLTFTPKSRIVVTARLATTPAIDATGLVSVLVDGRTVKSARLRDSHGNQLRFVLKPPPKGRHVVQVVFSESGVAMDARTGTVRIRVTK